MEQQLCLTHCHFFHFSAKQRGIQLKEYPVSLSVPRPIITFPFQKSWQFWPPILWISICLLYYCIYDSLVINASQATCQRSRKIISGFRKICWAKIHLFSFQIAATSFWVFIFWTTKYWRAINHIYAKRPFQIFSSAPTNWKFAGYFSRHIIHVGKWKSPTTINNEQ